MFSYQKTNRYFAQIANGLEEIGEQELSMVGAKEIKSQKVQSQKVSSRKRNAKGVKSLSLTLTATNGMNLHSLSRIKI